MLSRRWLCKVALPLIGVSYFLGTMKLFGAMKGSDYHRSLCSYMDNMAWDGSATTRYLADSVYTVTCGVYYPEPPSIHDINGDESLEPTPVPLHRRWGGRRDDLSIFDVYATLEEHSPTGIKEPQTGTVAYALVLTSCPEDKQALIDNNYDPGAQFYDASAITKHAICNSTVEGNAEYPFTLYAFVHPEAVVCEAPTGGTYDRVKMLQDLGYWVEIVGEAVTHDDLRDTQPYLSGHIFDDDVGIRDLIRLRLWQLTSHPIVVMMDWNTLMMKPLNDLFETLTNSDIPAMYVKNGDNEGVNTGLMLIKPSNDEFEKMKNAYINTPYDPVLGWNNEGHNDFPGRMGMSGFLSYYFSKTYAVEIDRCLYGNAFGSICENTRFEQVIVGRFSRYLCAAPWTCPDYDGEVNYSCRLIHSQFFEYRYDFETNHWSKKVKTERVGKYHVEVFKGYCKGPGEENYIGMTTTEPVTTQDEIPTEPENETPTVDGECRSACGRINDWDVMCPNKACRGCPECAGEPAQDEIPTAGEPAQDEIPTEPEVKVIRKKPKKRPTMPENEATEPPTEPKVPPTEPPTEPKVPPTEPPTEPKVPPTEPPTEPKVPPTEPQVPEKRKKPKKRPPTEPEEEIPAEPEEEIPTEPEEVTPTVEGECRSACARIDDWDLMCKNKACKACAECAGEPMRTQDEIPTEPENETPAIDGECRQPACGRINDWDLMCKNKACRACAECGNESLTSHTTNKDETLEVLRDGCRSGCANIGNWNFMCQSKSCTSCPECTGEPMAAQDAAPAEPQDKTPTEPEDRTPTIDGECRQPACSRIGDWDLMCKNKACRGCAECGDESLTSHTTNKDETLEVLGDECRPGCANVNNWDLMCQSKSCTACPECN